MVKAHNGDVCGFYSEVISKPESLHNNSHLLLAENTCLRRELTKLKISQGSLDDKATQHDTDLAVLKHDLDNLNDTKLQVHLEQDSKMLEQQNMVFEATNQLYNHWTIGLTIVLGIAGLISIGFLTSYKKREICHVVDESVKNVKEKLDGDEVLKSLVVNAFDDERVKSVIDGLADQIKSDIRNEQEFNIRSMINESLESEDIAQFRSILSGEDNDEN